MAEEVVGKIRVVQDKLEDFKRRISTFAALDNALKDSEVFLNIQISDLSEDFQKVKLLHSEIIANGDVGNAQVKQYIDSKAFIAIQNIFYKHSTNLYEFLKVVTKSERHDVTFTDMSQAAFKNINLSSNATFSNTRPHEFGLAYIQGSVPFFDGKYELWPEFKDSYINNVHENNSLTEAYKLKILHSLLKDDALKVIKREFGSLRSANYSTVWDKLNSRYNHKRTIVYSYFNALIFQASLEKETTEGLKSLYDVTYDTLASLKSLGLNVDDWGDLMLFIIYSKLPYKTKGLWDEKQADTDELPQYSRFIEFLEQRFRALESLEATRNNTNIFVRKNPSKKVSTFQSTSSSVNSNKEQSQVKQPTVNKFACKCCGKSGHSIRKCYKFKKMTLQERINLVNASGHCLNCLSFSHKLQECESSIRCMLCKEKHNTMLCSNAERNHQINHNSTEPINAVPNNQYQSAPMNNFQLGVPSASDGRFSNYGSGAHVQTNVTTLVTESETQTGVSVIFPTALVKVLDGNGRFVILRAMIDACSDASYITERAVQNINAKIKDTVVQIAGISDQTIIESRGIASFNIRSLVNDSFSQKIDAYVLKSISPDRPVQSFRLHQEMKRSIQLADPNFKRRSQIDLLLGGDLDSAIYRSGSFKSDCENIVFRDTELGWVASGSVPRISCYSTTVNCMGNNSQLIFRNLDQSIRRFWEVEEIPEVRSLTEEERLCESIFDATTVRLPSGKYSVSLPFKGKVSGFHNMRKIALSRFFMLEKRLSKNENLRHQYSQCLQEYIDLGHMQEVSPQNYLGGYYIPHHCVLKASSSTTKLRVVFDASAKDENLQSLNDNILNGPRLQADLLDHLLRFRLFKIAFTADVEKMYRQIEINPNDRRFQLILWRSNPLCDLKTYSLNTVTFGTTSAPYLAVKTLIRAATDGEVTYPKGSDCVKKGFYVDDCIYGADNIDEALQIQHETTMLLKTAGFHLRKWSSNSKELLSEVPESDRESKLVMEFDTKFSVKTLGVEWSPSTDEFHYQLSVSESTSFTKRSVLSEISKFFDPLGWIAPCLIKAKLLIQRLWSESKTWDEPLSEEASFLWMTIRKDLSSLSSSIKIPRWLHTNKEDQIEIHAFSDASEKAYAGAIFVKTRTENEMHVNLLFSKSKVAPLKKISLPRLELLAAVLLVRMTSHVKSIYGFHNAKFYFWSDSQITLAWIKDQPHKRTIFVANRVTEIQKSSNPSEWRYVESKKNPADLGTRGVLASDLVNASLWWHGPDFIKTFDDKSHSEVVEQVRLPEEDNAKIKKERPCSILQTFLTHRKSKVHEISSNLMFFSLESLNKFSTLNKLIRVVAYCLRFKKQNRSQNTHISPAEFEAALIAVLRLVQQESYHEDLMDIQTDGLSKDSSLYSLNPFINHDDGLLRVSGRLEKAEHLNYDQRHPVILPHSHMISKLIVRHAHAITLHGTTQQTFMYVSQRYHIIKCKSLIKWVANKCVKCFRLRCLTQQQLMGQLPKYRITPNRPFLNCGVDFAGPFLMKKFKGKCKSYYKSYFALFVCFSTKAIHLELVIDLSTAAFIAAYRRFISRRGLVRNMYSDCGTNFVGAERAITRRVSVEDKQWNEIMAKELAPFQTQWHFNPPGAPHFGGLWEAGVKSVKRHLKRIMGDVKLTYDEFETVLIQVEACLNSRPLCEIKQSQQSIVLTPGHFLIQDSLLSLPDDNLDTKKISSLDRWNILQKITQDFWKIWSHEYLDTLRERKKWKSMQENIRIGDVVVIKNSKLPPASWLLASVIDVHPGEDGLVRVVSLKTATSIFTRPITKICPLPVQAD